MKGEGLQYVQALMAVNMCGYELYIIYSRHYRRTIKYCTLVS